MHTSISSEDRTSGNRELSELGKAVLYNARLLADHPESVFVQEVSLDHQHIVSLRCENRDVGKILGRHGKNVEALRTLLYAIATKHGLRVDLQVNL